ncbi:MAG: hypothetical protein P8Z36_01705 [Gemmatimonadota bacterium]|jgi:hypothetical protein
MTRLIASTLFVLATASTGLFATARPAQASCNQDYFVCLNNNVYTAETAFEADYESVKCAARWTWCIFRQI